MARNIPLDVQLSKAMTWLLRHGAEKEGIQIEEGNLFDLLYILLRFILFNFYGKFFLCG